MCFNTFICGGWREPSWQDINVDSVTIRSTVQTNMQGGTGDVTQQITVVALAALTHIVLIGAILGAASYCREGRC